jgi:hypothetical protein
MDISDREMLIDYIARERAETWMAHGEEIRDETGLDIPEKDREDFFYQVIRQEGVPAWRFEPMEKRTNQELFQFYLDHYDVDPEQHLMDAWVTGEILNRAFAYNG